MVKGGATAAKRGGTPAQARFWPVKKVFHADRAVLAFWARALQGREPLHLVEEAMKALWISCAVLLLSARLASAGSGGINLGWSDCGGLQGGTGASRRPEGLASAFCVTV